VSSANALDRPLCGAVAVRFRCTALVPPLVVTENVSDAVTENTTEPRKTHP
jgi:hypothetical protein